MNKEPQNIELIEAEKLSLDTELIRLQKLTGQNYFDELVKFLCKKTGLKYAFVGTYYHPSKEVSTRSFYSNNKYIKQYSYCIKNTPCDNVIGKKVCFYPENVQSLFPSDEDLKIMNIEGYAGFPLFKINKEPIGVLVFLDDKPIKNIIHIGQIVDFFESKTELELERILLNEKLSTSQENYQELFENFQDVFFIVHYNENYEQIDFVISPSMTQVLGYTFKDLESLNFSDFYEDPEDRKELFKKLKKSKQIKNYPLTFKKKNGKRIYIELDCELFDKNIKLKSAFSLRGVLKDVTEKKTENLRKEIAFLIAAKSQRRLTNVKSLVKFIHTTLEEVADVSNFYIALHETDKNELYMPIFIDEHERHSTEDYRVPFGNSITEYIINSNQTIVADKTSFKKLIKEKDIKLRGEIPECFVGIPLKSEGKSFGAIVMQTYKEDNHYLKEDVELLTFIATQIGYILERSLWQESLLKKEKHYRSLVENSSEIVGVINTTGVLYYLSDSVERITGYKPSELIGRNLNEFIEIEALTEILNNRISDPNNHKLELLKITDKVGNKKYLEVSLNKNKNKEIIFNAKDVTQRIFSEKSRKFSQKRLRTLYLIEKALLSGRPVSETLNKALKIITKNLFDVDRISIGLFDNEKERIEIISLHSKYKISEGIKLGDYIPFSELASVSTTIKNKPFYVRDINKLKPIKKSDKKNKKDGILSYYIKPIVINHKVIGTFNFGSKSTDYFNKIDGNLLDEITRLIAVVINDMTLKKELAKREADLTTIFNSSNEGILQADNNGKFTVVNDRLCEMLGYSENELLAKNFREITYEPDLNYSEKIFKKIIKNKIEKIEINKKYQHKNGNVVDCKVTIKPFFNGDNLNYITAFIEDKTEERKALKKVFNLEKTLNYSAGVIFTDKNAIITDINEKSLEYNGYTREEIIGQSMRILNSNYHSTAEWKGLWKLIQSGKTWKGEVRNMKKDGSYYWIYATVIPILNNQEEVESYLTVRFDITKEKLAKSNTIKEVIEAQERERERFAMEIHDGLGQMMLASKMNLNALSDSISKESKGIYNTSLNLLNDAILEARNISHGLMSRVLNNFGLAHAVEEIINNINANSNLEFTFSNNLNKLRFNEEIEMGVYRTLQELIKNIINHSKASKASLSIVKNEGELFIKIKDNGVGIKQGTINNTKSQGIGLRNMKSRIEYLGGTFKIEKVKTGTEIKIIISL
jgi:two-component system, NarL family, sensor histidine kinase NreB